MTSASIVVVTGAANRGAEVILTARKRPCVLDFLPIVERFAGVMRTVAQLIIRASAHLKANLDAGSLSFRSPSPSRSARLNSLGSE
jgi:hypothetical protein